MKVHSPTSSELQQQQATAEKQFKKLDKEITRHVGHIAHECLMLSRKLWAMKQGNLYRAGGFKTMDEYCAHKRKHLVNMISQGRVSQLTQAGRVLTQLDGANVSNANILPENERQIAPLTKLKTTNQILTVLESVKTEVDAGRKLTAALIAAKAKEKWPKCFPVKEKSPADRVQQAGKLIEKMDKSELQKLMALLKDRI